MLPLGVARVVDERERQVRDDGGVRVESVETDTEHAASLDERRVQLGRRLLTLQTHRPPLFLIARSYTYIT